MKGYFQILLVVCILSFLHNQTVLAQCNSAGGYDYGNLSPTTSWQTRSIVYGGDYMEFTGVAGQTYTFSFCNGGGSSSFDTQITITQTDGTPIAGAYTDDDCGLQSELDWECTANGTYRVYVTEYNCQSNFISSTLAYRVSIPKPGSDCSNPVTVNSYPYNDVNTTCGAGDTYNDQCTVWYGNGEEDMVYELTIATTGNYQINLTNTDGDGYVGWFLKNNANCAVATCLDQQVSGAGNSANGVYNFTAAGTYYLVITADGFYAGSCTAYSLSIYPVSCVATTYAGYTDVASLPYSNTGVTTNGNNLTSGNMISCGDASYLAGSDDLYRFIPAATGNVTIDLTNASATDASIMLYQGCPTTGDGGVCVTTDQSNAGTTRTICAAVNAGSPYFLVVDRATASTLNYDIAISAPVAASSGGTCADPVVIPSLPYDVDGETTACFGNNYDNNSTGSCGSSYESGEDKVYELTVTEAKCIQITIDNANESAGFQVYSGCPNAVGSTCLGSFYANSSCSISSSATGSTGDPVTTTVDIDNCVPDAATILTADVDLSYSSAATCATNFYMQLGLLTQSEQNYGVWNYPICSGNYDYTSSLVGLYPKDRLFKAIAYNSSGLTETVTVNMTANFTYTNEPALVTLPGAGTYYIVVQTDATGDYNTGFDILVEDYGSAPSNDDPCSAQQLSLGVQTSGDNTCATGNNEPSSPGAWTNGNLNTVWYKATAPASGELRIKTFTNTLWDTQIALYSGACGAGLTLVSANDDLALCGGTQDYNSELVATGLTAGDVYYIAVDGFGEQAGSFSVVVIDDATQSMPTVAGQECSSANPVCSTTGSTGDPGYQGIGNICNHSGGGACGLSDGRGEFASTWYRIDIAAAGNLRFTIAANNADPSTSSRDGSYYEWSMWKIAGAGSTTCAGIQGGAAPVACKSSGYLSDVTGMYNGYNGGTPAGVHAAYDGDVAYCGSDPGICFSAFESALAVTAGDAYLLNIINWNENSGFSLDFSESAGGLINYSTTEVVWTGGNGDDEWHHADNWGGCAIPSSTIDAVVAPSSSNQPVLDNSHGDGEVKNLYISGGASLDIISGKALDVYGDFENYGELDFNANSTVNMLGTANQTIGGDLIADNKLGNLTINKTAGAVDLAAELEMGGNFTTSSTTSDFDANSFKMNIAGNVNLAASSFTPGAQGVMELDGTGTNTLTTNGNHLNQLTIDKTSGEIDLADELELDSSLFIESGTLDVTGSNHDIKIYNDGSWINGGGSFTYNAGTVHFLGDANQNVFNATQHFYTVIVNQGTPVTVTLKDSVVIHGDLQLLSGAMDVSTDNSPVNAKGNWIVNGGTFTPRNGKVYFSGSATQLVNVSALTPTLNTADFNFYDVEIDGTDVRFYSKSDQYKLNVQNDLQINTGKTLKLYDE